MFKEIAAVGSADNDIDNGSGECNRDVECAHRYPDVKIEEGSNEEDVVSDYESYPEGRDVKIEAYEYVDDDSTLPANIEKVRLKMRTVGGGRRKFTRRSRECRYDREMDTAESDTDTFSNERTYYVQDKTCRVCRVNFRFSLHYEKHFKNEHPDAKPYTCPCCPYEACKRDNFLEHMDAHQEQIILSRESKPKRVMKCESCRTEYWGIKDFDEHNASAHRGTKMIKCGLCNARFSWYRSLSTHEMRKHGMHDSEFQCKFCGSIYGRSDVLEKHAPSCEQRQAKKKMGVNEVDTNYVEEEDGRKICYECGKKCRSFKMLKEHFQRVHAQLKGCFMCKVCRKIFKTILGLEKHMDRMHADESEPKKKYRMFQNYKCPHCREEFQGLRLFETHGFSTHPGEDEKLFHCSECGEGFRWKRNLEQHVVNVHMNTTIYLCTLCVKPFKSKRSRRRHEIGCQRMRQRACHEG